MLRIAGLDVEPLVGLEVHVQLATRAKLFCPRVAEFGAAPGSRVCAACLGAPGAPPALNRQAVTLAARHVLDNPRKAQAARRFRARRW